MLGNIGQIVADQGRQIPDSIGQPAGFVWQQLVRLELEHRARRCIPFGCPAQADEGIQSIAYAPRQFLAINVYVNGWRLTNPQF